jgi:hypothetical protein
MNYPCLFYLFNYSKSWLTMIFRASRRSIFGDCRATADLEIDSQRPYTRSAAGTICCTRSMSASVPVTININLPALSSVSDCMAFSSAIPNPLLRPPIRSISVSATPLAIISSTQSTNNVATIPAIRIGPIPGRNNTPASFAPSSDMPSVE